MRQRRVIVMVRCRRLKRLSQLMTFTHAYAADDASLVDFDRKAWRGETIDDAALIAQTKAGAVANRQQALSSACDFTGAVAVISHVVVAPHASAASPTGRCACCQSANARRSAACEAGRSSVASAEQDATNAAKSR